MIVSIGHGVTFKMGMQLEDSLLDEVSAFICWPQTFNKKSGLEDTTTQSTGQVCHEPGLYRLCSKSMIVKTEIFQDCVGKVVCTSIRSIFI